jgi:hypothetical protein
MRMRCDFVESDFVESRRKVRSAEVALGSHGASVPVTSFYGPARPGRAERTAFESFQETESEALRARRISSWVHADTALSAGGFDDGERRWETAVAGSGAKCFCN